MDDHTPEVDERYLMEWVDYGIAEIESYLLKHARFERFLARTSDPGSEED